MNFINSSIYPWTHWSGENASAHFIAHAKPDDVVGIINEAKDSNAFIKNLTDYLAQLRDFQSCVYETAHILVAWVDHVRAYPLFYTQAGEELIIGPEANLIKEKNMSITANENSALQFAMAGYVTGRETIYNDLYVIEPGEFVVFDKKTGKLSRHRYYRYRPHMDIPIEPTAAQEKLGDILDAVTLKIIKRAGGRKIWVPLSAGLDSRILLCKLHGHGYQNLETFTYGPRLNFEALKAKRIAKTLGIKWQMISPSSAWLRKIFKSEERKNYWDYAGALKAIPSMREYSALCYLKEKGQLDPSDIFINGQTGDYLTGGHIPSDWQKPDALTINDLYSKLISKHYGLWTNLQTPENREIIKDRISELIGYDISGLNIKEQICSAHESWEYEGRQVSLVINGQRSYEFFGCDWELPLWDKALVDFYQTIPLALKWDQNLYRSYLKKYNYQGLFPQEEPYLWRWPIPMLWVVPLARLIGVMGGSKAKEKFYALMIYFGHYSNQWVFYPFKLHKKFCQKIRIVASLYVRTWFKDHPEAITTRIKEAMEL